MNVLALMPTAAFQVQKGLAHLILTERTVRECQLLNPTG